MNKYVFISFVFLGWAFYELSGGADFEPSVPERITRNQQGEVDTSKASQIDTDGEKPSPSPAISTPTSTPQKISLDITSTQAVLASAAADTKRPRLPESAALRAGRLTDPPENTDTDTERHTPSFTLPRDLLTTRIPFEPEAEDTAVPSLSSIETATPPTEAEPEPEDVPVVTEPQDADLRQVNVSRANMRQGPGTNYRVLAKLKQGDVVRIKQDPGTGWVELEVRESGEVGWISARLLNTIE